MKTIYKILSVLILPTVLILYSYSSGSPGGKTGSVGDGGTTCTQCHSGTAIAESGWITSDIPGEGYIPGDTYEITVTGTHDGVVKMGFELTAETLTGIKKSDWTITDVTRTQNANANTAVTHTQSGNLPNGNTNTWSVNWTAPELGTGTIRFYAAVNGANGNGNNSGDQIYTTTLTVEEMVVANPEIVSIDPNHGNQDSESDFLIVGNETSWNEGISNIMLKYHDDNNITLSSQSFTIDSDTEITVAFAFPFDQQIGVYDVYVDEIMLENGFTVDILDDITEDFASSIKLYPIPTQNTLNIQLPEGSEFRIINIEGRQMTNFVNAGELTSVDISGFETGIYFVQIVNNGSSISRKFIKN